MTSVSRSASTPTVSSSGSVNSGRESGRRMKVETPTWQQTVQELDAKVGVRRTKPSSIWERRLPERRHKRRLSWSNVGLAGNSPTYVSIRSSSPTREQKCRDRISMTMEMGDIEQLWEIYIESSAPHQDNSKKWPIPNSDFVKVRKAIEKGLRLKIRAALQIDKLEMLEAAALCASNKVQILSFQGNASFPELEQVYKRINEMQNQVRGTLKKSNTREFRDKNAAKEQLELAIEAQDGEELSKAILASIESGVNVTEAARHLRISSKYFSTSKDQLFDQKCFAEQKKRKVHILNLGPDLDLNLLERLLQVRGVGMKFYSTMKELFKPPQDRESRKGMSVAVATAGKFLMTPPIILQDPKKHTVWIISGPEPSKLAGDMAGVQKLIDFNRLGGGLGLVGSGKRGGNVNPLICDANVMLASLNYERMWGHFDGKKTVTGQSDLAKPGLNKAHPILRNVPKLDEGFSVSAVAESVLSQGFVCLQRGSSGKVLTAIREPSAAYSGQAGPIVLHASAMQMLGSKEGVGHEQWICNLFLYACLRAEDMTEEFNFGDQKEEEEPEEGTDEEDKVNMVGGEQSESDDSDGVF